MKRMGQGLSAGASAVTIFSRIISICVFLAHRQTIFLSVWVTPKGAPCIPLRFINLPDTVVIIGTFFSNPLLTPNHLPPVSNHQSCFITD